MQQYMTIPEFASSIGVTKQAVYKRLERDLQPYCRIIDKKRLISSDAATLFKKQPSEAQEAPVLASAGQPCFNTTKDADEPQSAEFDAQEAQTQGAVEASNNDDLVEALRDEVRYLREKLDATQELLASELATNSELQRNFQVLIGRQQETIAELPSRLEVDQPTETSGIENRKFSFAERIKILFTGEVKN